MTHELAIQRLDKLMDIVKPEIAEAIEWLAKQTEQSDTISRQAAINFKVSHGINEDSIIYVPYGEVKQYLEQLPSAQPADRNGQERTGTDLISRQAAIDEINKRAQAAIDWFKRCDDADINDTKVRAEQAVATFCEASLMLKKLPSAQPERKTGRWIRDEFGSRCGACGLYAYRDKFDRPWESPYCPNCGCKMEAEQ